MNLVLHQDPSKIHIHVLASLSKYKDFINLFIQPTFAEGYRDLNQLRKIIMKI